MLKATNLQKKFINKSRKGLLAKKNISHKIAVEDFSITVSPGEIVGLLGLNGAGKTTTIKMLSTLLTPTKGEITINGFNPVTDPLKVKSIINMIAGGERMLYYRLTGYQNLEYFGNLYGLKGDELRNRINILLKKVELNDVKDMVVEKYSKGMKQRLSIARGLINDPKYLFLDEPTLGLDVKVAKKLRNYIQELALEEKKGIILTSHYISEIEELCDRVYIMEKGKILLEDTIENIIYNYADGIKIEIIINNLSSTLHSKLERLAQKYQGSLEITDSEGDLNTKKLLFVSKVDISADIIQSIFDSGEKIKTINVERPNLEEVISNLEGVK
ncbi:ABC transporter ATP-binding protein [Bacillus salitolerans]|uniref:ABC transporter ATP-binding protein n=1 Tax=Bacillus salitolerans TaxID=1437434 RepID=A0ABW4LLV1_9BACI